MLPEAGALWTPFDQCLLQGQEPQQQCQGKEERGGGHMVAEMPASEATQEKIMAAILQSDKS